MSAAIQIVQSAIVQQTGCLACGAQTKQFVNGKFAKYCSDECCHNHQNAAARATVDRQPGACVVCGRQCRAYATWREIKFCSRSCRDKHRSAQGTRHRGQRTISGTCEWCQTSFIKRVQHGKRKGARNDVYCGKKCQVAAITAKHEPARLAARARNAEDRKKRLERRALRAALSLMWRTYAPLARTCRECKAIFFRQNEGYKFLCSIDCVDERKARYRARQKTSDWFRASRRKQKAKRRSLIGADNIDPIEIFERDSWRCQLCGCATPESLRGSNDLRAPEIDHRTPLSRGGLHTWRNVHCACRECNGLKGSMTVAEFFAGRHTHRGVKVVKNHEFFPERAPLTHNFLISPRNPGQDSISAQKPDAGSFAP